MTYSTIQRKFKICSVCGKYTYLFSKGRCQQCAKVESFNQKALKEAETGDLKELIAEADILFSRYIRLKSANKEGLVKCYTCDFVGHWKEVDAGHYISRACMFLRHDQRNARPQCTTCNRIKHGNLSEFGKRLESEYEGITEILYEESKIVFHTTREELRAIISDMTQKLELLKTEL